TPFRIAVQLRDGDHRDIELLREELQSTADLRDLLLAAVDARVMRHQLEVVDDDQAESLPAGAEAPRTSADVHDRHVAGVDDVERSVVERVRRLDDARPVVGAGLAGTDPVPLHAGLSAEQTHADLPARHLQGEKRNRLPLVASLPDG